MIVGTNVDIITNENTMLGRLDSDDLLAVRKDVKLLCKIIDSCWEQV